MSTKKNNNAAVKQLENKLKNAQMLNYILIAVCAVLLVVCIVLAASSCGIGNDLPLESTTTLPDTTLVSNADIVPGTYQYISADDSYGFAVEFTEDGAVWFYEATKDETLVQGFIGELVTLSDTDCYNIPLYHVDFVPYTTASVKIEMAANGNILLTQLDENALLTNRVSVGETVSLTPVENYSLDQVVVGLYADQMTE